MTATLAAARRRFDPIASALGRRNPLAGGTPSGGFDFHSDGPAWADSWLADDLDAGAVENWVSGSGNLTTLTQATGTKQPIAAADSGPGGAPGVTADGTDDMIGLAVSALSWPYSVVMVVTCDGTASSNDCLFSGTTDVSPQIYVSTGGTDDWAWSAGTPSATGTLIAAEDNLHAVVFNEASSNWYLDGTVIGGPTNVGTNDLDGVWLFNRPSDEVLPADFTVAFVGVFDGDVTADGNWWSFVDAVYEKWGIDARPPSLVGFDHLYWTEGAEFEALGLGDGEAVASWPDEEGTDDIPQATGTKQPTLAVAGLNDNPTVVGDGVDDFLQGTFAVGVTQPYSMVAVAQKREFIENAVGVVLGGPTEGGNNTLSIHISGVDDWQYALRPGTFLVDADAHLFTAHLNGASSAFEYDGTEGTGDGGSKGHTGLALLAGKDGVSPLDGNVALVGFVAGDVRTSSAWADFESYMEYKYGLTIA